MKKLLFSLAFVGMLAGFQSCKNDDDNSQQTTKQAVKENYAKIVYASYQDSHTLAVTLKEAIDAFVANPTQIGLDAAKTAWLAAREPYGQTEAYRFASGPIDTGVNQVEGLLNAWPLDESFIDYVSYLDGQDGDLSLNVINNLDGYPEITKEVLRGLNEYNENERSISVGYHAIEFLLWGQDTQIAQNGPEHTTGGVRPYTDYVVGGTADHQARRGQYLKLTAEILVEDLQYLLDEWDTNGNNYRTTFLSMDDDTALRNIMTGMGILAGAELAEERILVAVSNASQEDEHSCFSDNTHRDIRLNFYGVRNVYMGTYTRTNGDVISGASISKLLSETNATKDTEIKSLFTQIDTHLEETGIPFDYSMTVQQTEWNTVIEELQTLGDDFAEVSSILGFGTFAVEVP